MNPIAYIQHGLIEAPDELVWDRGAVGHYTPLFTRTGLRAEVDTLKQWIRDEGERTDTCTYNVLREVCAGCRCHRAKEST